MPRAGNRVAVPGCIHRDAASSPRRWNPICWGSASLPRGDSLGNRNEPPTQDPARRPRGASGLLAADHIAGARPGHGLLRRRARPPGRAGARAARGPRRRPAARRGLARRRRPRPAMRWRGSTSSSPTWSGPTAIPRACGIRADSTRTSAPGLRAAAQEVMDPDTSRGSSDGFRFRQHDRRGDRPVLVPLRRRAGARSSSIPGTRMVNPTTGWTDHLARFVATTVWGGAL